MKSLILLVSVAMGAAVMAQAAALVEVSWNPDARSYRDIEIPMLNPEESLDRIKDRFDAIFGRLSRRYLAPDQKLIVNVKDLDLAGAIEPARSQTVQDHRIIRSIYPPAITFDWKLVDAAGETLREGSEDLLDLNFEMRIRRSAHRRPYFIEEEMLRRWAHATFRTKR